MKNENYNYIDNVIDIAQVVGRGPSMFKMMAWIIIIINYYIDDNARVVGRGPSVGLDNIQNDGFDNSGSFNDYDDVIYDAHLGAGGPLDCV